jgi:hypothetical protein
MIPSGLSRSNPVIDLRMVASRQVRRMLLVMLATGAILLATTRSRVSWRCSTRHHHRQCGAALHFATLVAASDLRGDHKSSQISQKSFAQASIDINEKETKQCPAPPPDE